MVQNGKEFPKTIFQSPLLFCPRGQEILKFFLGKQQNHTEFKIVGTLTAHVDALKVNVWHVETGQLWSKCRILSSQIVSNYMSRTMSTKRHNT